MDKPACESCESPVSGIRAAPTVASGILAILLPKCPACLAAWAGVIGFGVTAPHSLTAPWLAPVLIAMLCLPALAGVIRKRLFDASGIYLMAGIGLIGARYFDLPVRVYVTGAIIAIAAAACIWKREHVRRTIQHDATASSYTAFE